MAGNGESPIQVLHLLGSSTSSFYFDLSVMYGRTAMECPELDRSGFTHRAVILYQNGKWGFPSTVDEAGVAEAEKSAVSFGAAMAAIEAMTPAVDVCVPHMFCVEGLTRYRTIIDMLGIELLGCPGEVCAVAQDKFTTKAVCEAGGVPVPKGELLRQDVHGIDVTATAQMLMTKHTVPFIVKPAKEDNSIGLSLVKTASIDAVSAALTKAFNNDEYVLVEEYIPGTVDEAGVAEAEKSAVSFGAAMAAIEAMTPAVDVCVPHMFCVEGLTRYRTIIDMLGIELLGCSGEVCAVAQDKFTTKAVCEAGGVPVPKGELLRQDVHGIDVTATAQMLMTKHTVPFIVKPAKEDNSIGLSLVKTASIDAVSAALTKAFNNDEYVLVEEYIPGRELRVAVLEVNSIGLSLVKTASIDAVSAALTKAFNNDEYVLVEEYIPGRELRVAVLEVEEADGLRLVTMPKIEYILEDIRESKHKLGTDSSGKLLTGDKDVAEAIKKGKEEGERKCPAELTDEVHARVDDLAKKAHKALGCKYYSLYDVRLNPDGMPFMLEACLFCSFSPYSVIVGLAAVSENQDWKPHPKLFESFLCRAARETRARR
eukprot:CAMPEP_0172927860 /NCGR_PEP_ID=MMETSP1075-20121228/217681_1 /TAXON_ID=2916 /ORGANISM="Ceratium fusus, Strain PA161109" /LENGTH=594 /DNA_ID=CAMNT_0013789137 /DNA_START=1 /DNA_END=1782 /DNA_ORIENTATION=-